MPFDAPTKAMMLRDTTDSNANAAPAYQFKARPVNKAILESAGDMGVPRVEKRAPTVHKEFALSTSSRPSSARGKVEVHDEMTKPLYSSFGGATKPRGTAAAAAKPTTAPKAKPAALTMPKEFSFRSSARPSSARGKVDVHDELTRPVFSSFGGAAKPVPPKKKPTMARSAPPKPKAAAPAAPPAAADKAVVERRRRWT